MREGSIRTIRAAAVALFLAAPTLGCSLIGLGGNDEEEIAAAEARRASCDQLAAQAIDAEDLREARRLAARASECYAAEVARGVDNG